MHGVALTSASRKKQTVETQRFTLPTIYKPRGATRAQQQNASLATTDNQRVEFARKRSSSQSEPQIEISTPGAGYVAIHREGAEPQLVRVVRPLQGATRARNGASAATSDGVKLARKSNEPFARRRQNTGSVADIPAWRERGLFKAGFTQAPRLKSAKLFTKGRTR